MQAGVTALILKKSVESVEEFVNHLRRSGWRGLIVAHSMDLIEACIEILSVASGEKLVLASKDDREVISRESRDSSVSLASYMDIEEYLGREYDSVLVVARGLLRPNIIAAAGEMVRRGGFLAIIAPERERWNPAPEGGRGVYKLFLENSFMNCKSILWINLDSTEVYLKKVFTAKPQQPPGPEGFKSRRGVPKKLSRVAANLDQAELLEEFAGFLRGPFRCFVVTGDRGRGKSGFLGLAVALAVYWHFAGPIQVVAPSPHSLSSFYKMLIRGLEELGVKHRVVKRGNAVVRVQGPWFKVYYEEPASAEPSPTTVIDEAAAVGVARVRRIARRGGKTLIATTVHGYEGSGRTFTHILLNQLPKPFVTRELRYPIRYFPGDPLEEWIYSTFMLKADVSEAKAPVCGGVNVEYVVADPKELVSDRGLLEKIYSVLVLAHYRNQPDDLLMMLEAPHHFIRYLRCGGEVIGVLEACVEEPGAPESSRILTSRLNIYSREAGDSRGVRIVRIAVHPGIQRRGYGSKLLRFLEEECLRKGFDWVGSVFSRQDVVDFWIKNGYSVFYVSPRYNRVTGEKNIGVIKPISELGSRVACRVLESFKARILVSSQSIYRDLSAEVLSRILSSLDVSCRLKIKLLPEQLERIEKYCKGELEYETVHDAVYLAVINKLCRINKLDLEEKELIALTARVLQGKTVRDTASILHVSDDEAIRIINDVVRKIVCESQLE